MLTVADIAAGQHAGDFAFLSACKTATGGTVLPDEAITLAAALHFTGYRHVIATLWSVWDDSAAAVTEAVYRDIVVDRALRPKRTATALHTAVRALRDGNRARPSGLDALHPHRSLTGERGTSVTSERDAVLAALTARLDRFAATQDEAFVLNPDAEVEAQRLEYLGITFVGGMVQVHAYALHQVAWYRWYRFACLPAGEDGTDLREAGRLFHALRPEHPIVGPAQLDDVLNLPEPMTAGQKAAGVYMDASRFLDKYRQTHDRDALDGAINLLRRAGRWMPDEHIRSLIHNELAGALRTRFSKTSDRASLDEAIEAAQDGVRGLPADDPDAQYLVANLANMLQVRYEYGRDPADLEEAIEHCCEALRLAGPKPDPTHLAALANALGRRARRGSPDHDEALRLARAAVAATPPSAPGAVTRRSNLAATLRDHYGHTSDPHDLDQAIEAAREAVGLAPAGHPDRNGVLGNLGGLLGIRHALTADPQDLDGAIDAFEAALPGPLLSDAERAEILAHLGRSLDVRAEATDSRPDLDRAIERLRAAVELTAAQDPKYQARIMTLGDVLMERAMRYGNSQDLDEAIDALRAAAASTPVGDPHRGGRYITLSIRLRQRALRRRAVSDLDKAIAIAREAVAMADDPGDRAVALANLGTAMVDQFDFGGDIASLDAAVDTGRAAVAACPEGYEHRLIILDQLIVQLKARFDRLGDRADLDEAVQTAREAWPPGAARDRSIGNLDTILATRFKEYGAPADLVEAIELQRLRIDCQPKRDRGRALFNLGSSLRLYFGQTGDQSALDEAIGAYRVAAELLAADPLSPVALTQLASALLSRYSLADVGRDLDAAEAAARAAVVRATGTYRANALVTLGRVLRTSDADGRLDRAADAFREAMELTPTDHPVHGDAMLGLAAILADGTARPRRQQTWRRPASSGRPWRILPPTAQRTASSLRPGMATYCTRWAARTSQPIVTSALLNCLRCSPGTAWTARSVRLA
jgi:tetratricopeptide (TPR) repeat protein